MVNPTIVMKAMNAKAGFEKRHPKFTAFFNAVVMSGLTEGTVLEITVVKPGEDPVTANMQVTKEDLDMAEELKSLSM